MSQEDVALVEDEAKQAMDKSVRSLRAELQKVRTGRASTALLDGIQVDYYGTPTPLNQMANLTTPDPRLIVVNPFDKSVIHAVEKAIQASDLGLTPSNDGKVVRILIPALTEERRKELVKIVRHETETGRVAVRNIRRNGLGDVKELLKEKLITKDEDHHAHDEIQKLTDSVIAEMDQLLKQKETEIMEF